MNEKLKLDVFIDYICPWCYLSTAAIEKLQAHYPVEVNWLPFPLHPSTPRDGMLLTDLFPGRDLETTHQRLYEMLDAANLEHVERTHIFNTRLAQELGVWATDVHHNNKLHGALFRAYFVNNQDISDQAVLLDIVESCSLNREEAAQVLEHRSFSDDVDAAWEKAAEYNVTGVPCFITNNFVMAGCQPYEELQRFINFALSKED